MYINTIYIVSAHDIYEDYTVNIHMSFVRTATTAHCTHPVAYINLYYHLQSFVECAQKRENGSVQNGIRSLDIHTYHYREKNRRLESGQIIQELKAYTKRFYEQLSDIIRNRDCASPMQCWSRFFCLSHSNFNSNLNQKESVPERTYESCMISSRVDSLMTVWSYDTMKLWY